MHYKNNKMMLLSVISISDYIIFRNRFLDLYGIKDFSF